jgi:hypothetical protein
MVSLSNQEVERVEYPVDTLPLAGLRTASQGKLLQWSNLR